MGVTSLRAALRRTANVRLKCTGGLRGFVRVANGKPTGHPMRGLTKALQNALYSEGALPSAARSSLTPRAGKKWKGKQGGRRRGRAVDAQLTALINGTKSRSAMRLHSLSKYVLCALKAKGLTPVLAQRAVMNGQRNVATAADILALGPDNSLVVVELKTGHDQGRLLPATKQGRPQTMRGPLSRASDCVYHRHLAQLTATRHMLTTDPVTMGALAAEGITRVDGMLLYCTDTQVDCHDLDDWWKKKGAALVRAL